MSKVQARGGAVLAAVVVLVLTLAGCASTMPEAPASSTEPLNLTGEWEQVSSAENGTHAATIVADTISVYWIGTDGERRLYWAGTVEVPSASAETFVWDSRNDTSKTSGELLASDSDTKAFTYANGTISYEASALGNTWTVELKQASTTPKPAPAAAEAGSGPTVKIVGASFSSDYEGKPVIVVSYEFTNNSDSPESFLWAVDAQAFQGGIELDDLVFDVDGLDDSAARAEIKPGVTATVQQGYLLRDSSIVTVEVRELLASDALLATQDFTVA